MNHEQKNSWNSELILLYFFITAPPKFEPNTLQDVPLLKDLFVSRTKTTQWIPVPMMLGRGSAGSLTQIKKEININKLGGWGCGASHKTRRLLRLVQDFQHPSIFFKGQSPTEPEAQRRHVMQPFNNNLCQWHSWPESCQVLPLFPIPAPLFKERVLRHVETAPL